MADSEITADGGHHTDVVIAAQLRATQIHELWGITDRPVTLGEAHRLLDVAALVDVLVTAMVRQCQKLGIKPPYKETSGSYAFPFYPVLLPVLREWSWGWILDGKLIVSAIDSKDIIKGKRFVISPDRLGLLYPDFEDSSLKKNGEEVVCDVLVECAPPLARVAHKRRYVSEPELARCIREIVAKWPKDRRLPSRDTLDAIVKAELGCHIQRDRIREARKNHAPDHWQIGKGRPRP